MSRDPYGLQGPDSGPEPEAPRPALTPSSKPAPAREPDTVLWKFSGPGQAVTPGTPDREPLFPKPYGKYAWRIIARAQPGYAFEQDRKTGAWIEKPIT